MRGRKRPQAEKAQAVGVAVATGSIAEASRMTGIPEPTIHAWYHSPEFEELRSRKTDDVTAEWWAGVQKAFRRTVDLLDGTEDPVKAATAGAIMFDKMALSRGDPTARTESTLLRGRSDHEQQLLADVLNHELERRAYPDAAGDQATDPVAQSAQSEPDPA